MVFIDFQPQIINYIDPFSSKSQPERRSKTLLFYEQSDKSPDSRLRVDDSVSLVPSPLR